MPREHSGHSKYPFPPTQDMTLPKEITKMVNTKIRLIIFFVAEDEEAIQSAKTRSGASCGSDHHLLIAKFRTRIRK